MDRIWAPWRIEYVSRKRTKGCIFCKIFREKNDKKNLILFRSQHCFAVFNKFPYNNGHLMIVANKHVDFFDALSDKASSDIIKTLTKVKSILKKTIKPGGFNIGLNVGKIAGAGVDKHLHFHLVPRWQGDTNFMPILASTKLISQSLNDLYKKMKKEVR